MKADDDNHPKCDHGVPIRAGPLRPVKVASLKADEYLSGISIHTGL